MSDNNKSRKVANEQLMPCPFCGERAYIIRHIFGDVTTATFGVKCGFCYAQSDQYFDTMGEAVAAWNTRKEVKDEP